MRFVFSNTYRFIISVYTLIVYTLAYFVPSGHWTIGFLMLSLPIVIILNLFFLVSNLLIRNKRAWFYGALLLLSFPFWKRTFGFHFSNTKTSSNSFSVMSFNVMDFDVLNHLDHINPQNATDLMYWAVHEDVDIKCFQEFYNHHTNNFNTIVQFRKNGYKYRTILHTPISRNEQGFLGVAIMSKYPILDTDEKVFGDMNGVIRADIAIKKDTIRVINVHLRSLVVRFSGIKKAYTDENYDEGKTATKTILSKIKHGFEHHAEEIEIVEEWIKSSPYPVIVCGDFNETPYSYVYGRLRKTLNNGFEEAGSGFGFSYKNAPKYIRIDNQFYQKEKFEIESFATRADVKHSDHFPIIGRYRLKSSKF